MSTTALPTTDAALAPARRRSDQGSSLMRTVRYVLLVFFLLVVLLPAYVLFVTSFKGLGDATPSRAWALPQSWETAGWDRA
jgi:glucose/mannose transport system permease protein